MSKLVFFLSLSFVLALHPSSAVAKDMCLSKVEIEKLREVRTCNSSLSSLACAGLILTMPMAALGVVALPFNISGDRKILQKALHRAKARYIESSIDDFIDDPLDGKNGRLGAIRRAKLNHAYQLRRVDSLRKLDGLLQQASQTGLRGKVPEIKSGLKDIMPSKNVDELFMRHLKGEVSTLELVSEGQKAAKAELKKEIVALKQTKQAYQSEVKNHARVEKQKVSRSRQRYARSLRDYGKFWGPVLGGLAIETALIAFEGIRLSQAQCTNEFKQSPYLCMNDICQPQYFGCEKMNDFFALTEEEQKAFFTDEKYCKYFKGYLETAGKIDFKPKIEGCNGQKMTISLEGKGTERSSFEISLDKKSMPKSIKASGSWGVKTQGNPATMGQYELDLTDSIYKITVPAPMTGAMTPIPSSRIADTLATDSFKLGNQVKKAAFNDDYKSRFQVVAHEYQMVKKVIPYGVACCTSDQQEQCINEFNSLAAAEERSADESPAPSSGSSENSVQ